MLNILAERQFPVTTVHALASARSQDDVIDFGKNGPTLKVANMEHFDFARTVIALFAAGSDVAKREAPIAASAGAVVIHSAEA